MAEQDSLMRWYQAAADLFTKHQGNIVVALGFEPFSFNGDAETAAKRNPSFWARCAERVYSLDGRRADEGPSRPAQSPDSNVTLVGGDPVAFLESFRETIDLLILDGWPVGSENYKQRHLDAYNAARPRFHDRTVILIGDTGRDYGGKAALVLPQSLQDGFQVLLWGGMTLLARVSPASVRDVVPRIGPPLPVDASFDDGVRMHREGLHWEAEHIYRAILRQWPEHVGVLHLLGVACHQRGDHLAGLNYIGKAIALAPEHAVYFNNYGAALHALGRHVEALTSFHRALQIRPEYPDAQANLGMAQEALGQDEAALASYRKAVEEQAGHREGLARQLALLEKLGRDTEAIALYEKAVVDRPCADFFANFGNLLVNTGRAEHAIVKYEKALELEPDFAQAHFNLASCHQLLCNTQKARESFQRAARMRPEKVFWQYREIAVCPAVFQSTQELDAYRGELCAALDALRASTPPATAWNDLLLSGLVPYFDSSYHGRNNRALKEKFAALYEHYFRNEPAPEGSGLKSRRRIGFLVTQRHEGVFVRCMRGIMEHLDRERFELVVLCSAGIVERLRKSIRRDDVRFVPFPHSLPEAVARIRNARCDLIFYWEVGSDPTNYLLPFARLAPVQCTSWGSMTTSGVHAVDYFYSSELVETDRADEQYTEKLWRSKGLFMNDPRLPQVAPVSRDRFGLPDRAHLYVCLQNPRKLHPDMDPLFRGILERDPNGALVLYAGRPGNLAPYLQERFAKTMPGMGRRILFLPFLKFDDYCRMLQLADVILDPVHFGGGISNFDVFSYDLPIVTMPGELLVGRGVYALYRKMQILDLVASSADDYVRLATQVAGDYGYRMSLRERIRQATELVFDDREVVLEHERFFTEALEFRL
jgi:protein O-GlcNAc transferase